MAEITLVLPLTPSLNAYYRSVPMNRAVKVLISREGKAYRSKVQSYLLKDLPRDFETMTGPLHVKIEIYMSRRGSDGDNRLKGLFDALQHGLVFANDSQVCIHEIHRYYDPSDPRVRITIKDIPATPDFAPYLDAWKEAPKPPRAARRSRVVKTPENPDKDRPKGIAAPRKPRITDPMPLSAISAES